jgi:hypothetical protein
VIYFTIEYKMMQQNEPVAFFGFFKTKKEAQFKPEQLYRGKKAILIHLLKKYIYTVCVCVCVCVEIVSLC